MKKTTTLALIICSAFIFSACTLPKKTDNPATNSKTEQKKNLSIKDLISQGVAQKCVWEVTSDQGVSRGEILIKGKKFKQNINIKSANGETKFNGISDGEYLYTWSDDSKIANMAFKMKMDLTQEEQDTGTPQGSVSSVDWNQKYDYNCQPAIVSDADFNLPTGINFQDIGEMAKQFQQ